MTEEIPATDAYEHTVSATRTYVRSTPEVGSVRVLKTESKGKANKRIRIELVE